MDQAKAEFWRDGLVVIRGLIPDDDIAQFRTALRRALLGRLNVLETAHDPDGDLDSLLSAMAVVDRREVMTVIRGMKNSTQFHRMMSHPKLLELARTLLSVEDLATVHDVALLRVDPPHDHDRDFAWHQDYPYNMISDPAVTVWVPLTPVDEPMGPMAFVPGSHRALVPIAYDPDYENAPGSGNARKLFSLAVNDDAFKDAVTLPATQPGDVVAFHCLTLHRSGQNVSDRARWVLNFRYGDNLDRNLMQRGWRTVDDRNHRLFVDIHPEHTRRPR